MRLLFIQQYFYPDNSAVAQLLSELTRELSDRYGHEVHVLCSTNSTGGRPSRRRIGSVVIHSVPVPPLGRRTIIRRIAVLALYYATCFVWGLLPKGFDAVVVLTTPPFVGFIVALAMAFSRKPLVYYIEDLYPEILLDCGIVRRPWLIKKLGVLNRITLRRANAVISISRDITRKLYLNYRYSPARVIEVPNWSTSVRYEEPRRDGLALMYSGNFGVGHDFSLLPSLLCELKACEGIRYELNGGGVRLGEVRRLFREAGEQRVTFRTHVDLAALSASLAGAHYFLLAQSERVVGDLLPSKLYGYLAAGRPIIFLGTRASEIGRLIVDAQLGFVVERASDVRELGRKLAGSIERWEVYREWCARIAGFYEERFGLERSASRVNGAIEGAIAR